MGLILEARSYTFWVCSLWESGNLATDAEVASSLVADALSNGPDSVQNVGRARRKIVQVMINQS